MQIQTSDNLVTPKPGGQDAFWNDWTSRYLALEGGWGAGKTYIGARKLLTLHIWNSIGPDNKPTGVSSAVIAPTYPNARDFDVPAIKATCDEFGIKAVWRGADNNFVFPGLPLAPIMVRTADKPERITGWEVGAFWGDEATRWKTDAYNPKNDPLTQIKGRLRAPKARVLQGVFTYTNEGDQTAIYQEFRAGHEDHALYRARTADNDEVSDFLADMKRNLTPEMAEQYLEGGAMSLSGARAYAMFDNKPPHVDEDVELVDNLPLVLALDFNIRPGMHGLLGQYDKDADEFRIVHELHRSRLTIRDLCMVDLVNVLSGYGEAKFPELMVFGDPAGQARSAADGRTDFKVVSEALNAVDLRHRFSVASSDPGVVTRVSAVNVALRDMSGQTHVRIHPRCKRLIEDLQKVRWSEDGTGLDKKQTDLSHASDALAYWVERVRPVRINTGGTARIAITRGHVPAVGR